MKIKRLEKIIGAGIALSINLLISCQSLQNYTPASQEAMMNRIEIDINNKIKSARKDYINRFTLDGDYIVTRNSPWNNPLQYEIMKEFLAFEPKDYIPKYQTSAHKLLMMEQEMGAAPSDFKTLDALLDTIIGKISRKESYTKKEAFNVFKTIASELTDFEKKENDMLSYGLREKIFDCDNFSIIYYSVGEILNLPIKMISVLDHVFVRWNFGSDHLNWDNMWGEEPNKAFMDWVYRINFGLDEPFVEMNQKEIAALGYFNRASYLYYQNQYERANKEFDKALALFPNFSIAYFDKGFSYMQLKEYDKSVDIFSHFIKKMPDFAMAYNSRGLVYSKMGKYEEAIRDFTRTIELSPESDVAYFNRADAWSALGNDEQAVNDRKQGYNLKYKLDEDEIIWVE